jgi:hypothetical protein
MVNSHFPQYVENLMKLLDAKDSKNLYKKEFANGNIVDKSGSNLIWSVSKNVFYKITFQSKKIESIENNKLESLFDVLHKDLNNKDSTKTTAHKVEVNAGFSGIDSPENMVESTQENPTPGYPYDPNFKVTPLNNNLPRLLDISKQFEKIYPLAQGFLKDNINTWIDEQIGKNNPSLKEFTKKMMSIDFNILKKFNGLFKKMTFEDVLSKMSPKDLELIQHCLILDAEIKNKALSKDHILSLTFLNIPTAEVEKLAGLFYAKLKPLRDTYLKECEKVSVGVDGKLQTNLGQLKSAFDLTLERIIPALSDSIAPQYKILVARMTQYILCGQEINTVPFPEDEFCFTCKELNEVEDVQIIDNNPFQYYVESSQIYVKAKKPTTQFEANNDVNKRVIDDCLKQFSRDLNRHKGGIHFKEKTYHIQSAKELSDLFLAIKNDYCHNLCDKDQHSKLIEFNQSVNDNAGISNTLTKVEFKKLLEVTFAQENHNLDSEGVDAIIGSISLNGDDIQKLKTIFPDKNDDTLKGEMEAQLISHFIQIMSLLNQTSSAIFLDPKEHPNVKLNEGLTTLVSAPNITTYNVNSYRCETVNQYTYGILNDSLEAVNILINDKEIYELPSEESSPPDEIPPLRNDQSHKDEAAKIPKKISTKNEITPKLYQDVDVPFLRLERKFEVKLTNDEELPSSRIVNYSKFTFCVQPSPLIDKIIDIFKPSSVLDKIPDILS